MRQTSLFYRSLRESPKEAQTVSHQLLVRATFIDQISAGIWSLLPLGFRVFKKIENIIREEIDAIGGQELLLPTLQPKDLWIRSGRWDKMEPPLYKIKDAHQKEFALGPTHEEVITDLAGRFINSYKQLPLYLYQIQNKFRNEIRVSGGLLRVKEFIMKDLYSFHASSQDLDDYYLKVLNAYNKIFKRCELEVVVVKAVSGSIGGDYCHEFMALAPTGEDKILICRKCRKAVNFEAAQDKKSCQDCGGDLDLKNGIEAGHIFKLGRNYSQKMQASFADKDGRKKPLEMGCYGLGLGRLMATIAEKHHDEDGLIWPRSVSPFAVHFLNFCSDKKYAEKIYNSFLDKSVDVLFDERDTPPSVKLKDADLIGIPWRVILSDKTKGKIEVKARNKTEQKIMTPENFITQLLKNV
ncbi:MAG: proline--tRNA ligase [Patescibacteria group bacterium]